MQHLATSHVAMTRPLSYHWPTSVRAFSMMILTPIEGSVAYLQEGMGKISSSIVRMAVMKVKTPVV